MSSLFSLFAFAFSSGEGGPLAVDEVKRKDLYCRLAFTLPLPH